MAKKQVPLTAYTPYVQIYAGTGRAAIFVHKRCDIAEWTPRAGHNWAIVEFKGGQKVWTVYSEPDSSPYQRYPIGELAREEQRGSSVLVGDFNIYYLL